MDREILFRGKIKGSNTGHNELDWAFGDLVRELETGRIFILDLAHFDESTKLKDVMIEVAPETVCQYTGYSDLRKNKAFVHNIVFFEDGGCFGHIVFKEGQLLIEWEGREDLRGDIHFWFTKRRVHIVGNIFDNPELLEGGTE